MVMRTIDFSGPAQTSVDGRSIVLDGLKFTADGTGDIKLAVENGHLSVSSSLKTGQTVGVSITAADGSKLVLHKADIGAFYSLGDPFNNGRFDFLVDGQGEPVYVQPNTDRTGVSLEVTGEPGVTIRSTGANGNGDLGTINLDNLLVETLPSASHGTSPSNIVTDPAPLHVTLLYQAAFGRAPDAAGLSWNADLLRAGTSIDSLADAFLASAEFKAHGGANLSDEAYVTELYENALGRAPDAAGYAGWLSALKSGALDRGDLMVAFTQTEEAQVHTLGFWLPAA